jgi:hypothetical protein|tara:strand:- start:151 stop:342 length:192 start_codon:yes stop_codon:yes gene_type:complete
MKEIDEMLNRWIRNSIIRKELMDLIIKETNILATEYAEYSLDVRQQLMERPMTYEEWYEAKQK